MSHNSYDIIEERISEIDKLVHERQRLAEKIESTEAAIGFPMAIIGLVGIVTSIVLPFKLASNFLWGLAWFFLLSTGVMAAVAISGIGLMHLFTFENKGKAKSLDKRIEDAKVDLARIRKRIDS